MKEQNNNIWVQAFAILYWSGRNGWMALAWQTATKRFMYLSNLNGRPTINSKLMTTILKRNASGQHYFHPFLDWKEGLRESHLYPIAFYSFMNKWGWPSTKLWYTSHHNCCLVAHSFYCTNLEARVPVGFLLFVQFHKKGYMPVTLISGLCSIEGWTPTEIPICYIPAYPFVRYWLLDFDLAEMFCSYNRPNRSRNSSRSFK